MAEATGPEVRGATFWCRVYTCPNHAPREVESLPLGWLRVQMGVRDGKSHWMTFCSPACLRDTLERTPAAFVYDPRIDRSRIERARRRPVAPFNGPRVQSQGQGVDA